MVLLVTLTYMYWIRFKTMNAAYPSVHFEASASSSLCVSLLVNMGAFGIHYDYDTISIQSK